MTHAALLLAIVASDGERFLLSGAEVRSYIADAGLRSELEREDIFWAAFLRLLEDGFSLELRQERMRDVFGHVRVAALVSDWN